MLIFKKFSSLETPLRAFLLIGFLGGYTTFSSFSFETINLIEAGYFLKAASNIILNPLLCIMATWLGIILERKVTGLVGPLLQ